MVLSLNYNILNIITNKILDFNSLSGVIKYCKNIEKDDKTYIVFCFDGNDDEKKLFLKKLFLKKYFNEIDKIPILTNEQKEILKNKVNNKSTGPNGAKNDTISYFINCDLFNDLSILHFVDDDDISATTKEIRNYTNGIQNYAYSLCYKTKSNKGIFKNNNTISYNNYKYKDIYGLHELFITKQFIKNIPLLQYGIMNKEDLDFRSRLYYIYNDSELINICLYRYFTPTTEKNYKSDNEDLLTFETTNFMNYELNIAGKLKIDYKNKKYRISKRNI